jgi:hypothetical protein
MARVGEARNEYKILRRKTSWKMITGKTEKKIG